MTSTHHASGYEFERGLLANRVAKRCAMIEAAADRELIWFVQYLSHHAGGLAAVARDLLARYPKRIGTSSILEIGNGASGICTADQVRKIRMELPPGYRSEFPLKGETPLDIRKLDAESQANKFERQAEACAALERRRLEIMADEAMKYCDASQLEIQRGEQRQHDVAKNNPASYPVAAFRELCQRAAVNGIASPDGDTEEDTYNLERQLSEMCLNPEWDFAAGGPWYFPRLIETIRDYQTDFVVSKGAGVVVTAIGKQVCDALNYTSYGRILTLIQGEARTGKSFSARAWCEQHPGLARFIEVPPGIDELGFFHSIARGLGLGNHANSNLTQIRESVESVLLTGDILLVLDEAQRLWPRSNLRHGRDPKRIVWVMKWANDGVPIAMIATPQFIETQKAIEKDGWNSAQLTGRIGHYVSLPPDLSREDFMAVAKSILPGGADQDLRALAAYARKSARGLAGIDSVSKRALWNAKMDGRKTVAAGDVQKAMIESVIPSDTKLQLALATGEEPRPAAVAAETLIPISDDMPPVEAGTPRHRTAAVAATAPASRRADLPSLVTD